MLKAYDFVVLNIISRLVQVCRFRISVVNRQHFGGVMVWRMDIARAVYVAGICYCYFAGFRPVESEVWGETERRDRSALS